MLQDPKNSKGISKNETLTSKGISFSRKPMSLYFSWDNPPHNHWASPKKEGKKLN
jgi:hypothetical protein